MVRSRNAAHVRSVIQEALDAGATPLLDPDRFPESRRGGAYLGPQLLVDVDHSMTLMRDETFGPCVGIIPVDDDEEAITRMNDSWHGLTAPLWTPDVVKARAIGAQLETGTVFMNRCDYLDPISLGRASKTVGAAPLYPKSHSSR